MVVTARACTRSSSCAQAMERIHAILPDGKIVRDVEVRPAPHALLPACLHAVACACSSATAVLLPAAGVAGPVTDSRTPAHAAACMHTPLLLSPNCLLKGLAAHTYIQALLRGGVGGSPASERT